MMHKWVLRHSEDIGGALLAMMYKLVGFNLLDIDLLAIGQKLMTEAPSMFLAGFMGGLGGFTIRWMVEAIRFSRQKNRKNDEEGA